MANRLITIPPSHYCEKARWALELCGVEYVEEGSPPLFHVPAVKGAGGRRSTPVLVTDEGVYADSTNILEYLDAREGVSWRPYPTDPELRREAVELEELFDTALGPHTRRLAYYYLMQHKDLFLSSVLAGVEGARRGLFRLARPAVVFLMRKSMRIDDRGRDISLEKVQTAFAEVGERLGDGRQYLVGGRFTAADLTFAALGAPAVLPSAYGSPLPSLEEAPSDLRVLVEDFRTTSAGRFILRCYEEHR
ncbi:MAG: glutathione S-transferase family protein [Holophagae bacterium]|jgi:glutathione S-transferase